MKTCVSLSGHFGTPKFNSAFFVAMIAGVITSVIESIGDYFTCARLAGALPPPPHAINRGNNTKVLKRNIRALI
ncbi:hypothetical protein DPMN_144590 [Dreissena polymorpha]|uniref:Uncharacterized protein n=1 Tax=Dreissena polymorpha TaxID=45954 RepID=A0A9D4JPC7_DREPO|nr:hypothetical protein DPMN_142161 [Dreissena polymorpha]KAH3816048.1 hypothetical protein DPMN_144590 [Dreissena polymorpha]